MNAPLSTPPSAAPALMARHGRTFSWASRFMAGRDAERAASLYAFCHEADDLVDESGFDGRAVVELSRDWATWRHTLDPEGVVQACVGKDVLEQFVLGLASDVGPVRVQTHAELLTYAYRVAGCVGLMMCRVLDVTDPRATAFAIDLGIAMQLTNIARDVLEDAGRDRVYLPADASGGALDPHALVAGARVERARAWCSIEQLLGTADAYYRSADRGLRFLPFRARLAVTIASRVYQAIGHEILRRGSQRYWDRRCVVSAPRRLGRTFRALAAALFRPSLWPVGPASSHAAAIHLPLRGLPGADTGA